MGSSKKRLFVLFSALALSFAVLYVSADSSLLGNNVSYADESGILRTYSDSGAIRTDGAFFQSLGTNGRSCVSCHQPSDAFGITPAHVQARFDATNGTDPIFRPVDGANCPTDDVSTVDARRSAYNMLLSKGLIRVSMAVPANAEFTIEAIDDPYHCATPNDVALFRRPLPSTNLKFLSAVMWDGRESRVTGRDIKGDLASQAIDATLGHAQAAQAPTPDQVADIVNFETQLFTAQDYDNAAGPLNSNSGNGNPINVAKQTFYLGINDVLGADPTGAPFSQEVFTIYEPWANAPSEAQRSVARGEDLFNNMRIPITGVPGLNDVTGQTVFMGGCVTCHDTPNAGNHSTKAPLNIGLTDASRRTPDMPLYTLKCTATGQTYQTTDPGMAMITGKCGDIGKFKGPILRGLAARAPYFHNGSAATLGDAVEFYNQRFGLNLSAQQKADLVAFLKTL